MVSDPGEAIFHWVPVPLAKLTMVVNSVASFTTYQLTSRFRVSEQRSENQRTISSSYSKTLKEQLTGVMKELTWAKESMVVGYLGAQPNVSKALENRGYISELGI
jgi:hypothetical protein